MSTLVVYSDTTDGGITSNYGYAAGGTQAQGIAGTYSVFAGATATTVQIGQYCYDLADGDPYDYWIYEAFLQFDTSSVGSGSTVSAAVLNLMTSIIGFTSVLQCRLHDWGTALTTADWVAADSALTAKTLLAHATPPTTSNTAFDLTNDAFPANVNKTGSTRVILHEQNTADYANHSEEGYATMRGPTVYTADYTGTTSDPVLTVTYSSGGSNTTYTPAVATLATTGYAPVVYPVEVSLLLTFFAPAISIQVASANVTCTIPLVALVATGLAPSLVRADSYATGLATLTVSGLVPSLVRSDTYATGLATLTVSGLAPSRLVSNNIKLTPGMWEISVYMSQGYSGPHLGFGYTTGVASLTLTGLVPVVTASVTGSYIIGLATLTVAGLAPSLVRADKYTAGLATLLVSGAAPSLVRDDVYTAGLATLIATTLAPSLVRGTILTPATVPLSLTLFDVSLAQSANLSFTPDPVALRLTGYVISPPLYDWAGANRERIAAGVIMQEFFPRSPYARDHKVLRGRISR